ncbi:DegV family protein [[Clostridium] cellulosi]|jgi:EDD domain protein, DegV family
MFDIITDSTANLPEEIIDEFDIKVISVPYFIGGKEYQGYEKGKKPHLKEFYDAMRKGEVATTAQMSRESCRNAFESSLKEGRDFIYIGFSSALSGMMNTASLVADELRKEYPERKFYVIDSLSASMGQGLLVYYAAVARQEGKDIDEVKASVEEKIPKLCHWFTVDDLKYLKRGGRISSTTALVGTLMGIKPILHVDDKGRIVSVGKVRGRRNSIEEVFKRMKERCLDTEDQMIFIAHSDCENDAKYLASLVKNEYKVKGLKIGYIDAVIGAHSGPGTLAVFFLGTER